MNDFNEQGTVKKQIIKYISAIFVCSLMTVLFLLINHYFDKTELVEKYKILADAFSLAGLLPILVCALIALSNHGAFDSLAWMMKRFFKTLIPLSNKSDESYADYKARRKSVTGFSFIIYVGLVFLAVGIVFIVLFYGVYEG